MRRTALRAGVLIALTLGVLVLGLAYPALARARALVRRWSTSGSGSRSLRARMLWRGRWERRKRTVAYGSLVPRERAPRGARLAADFRN